MSPTKSALIIYTSIIVFFIGYYQISLFQESGTIPKFENTWWGSGNFSSQENSIKPFVVKVSNNVLEDLQYRLEHHRPFTPPLENTQQQYGTNTKLLAKFVEFWKSQYHWREREQYLNQHPQFITNIQGLTIHFLHVKPPKNSLKVLPILMLHGWPGSIREFYEIIPLLTQPQPGRNFIFEVIVPSLPGYAFSQATTKPGLGAAQMAVLFQNFMKRLGFPQYYVQGGDFGAIILQQMAVLFPNSVLGFHSNMCTVLASYKANLKMLVGGVYPKWIVKEEHQERVYPLKNLLEFALTESGYLHLQATKPDTLGVGLKDSPVGLAAYILEKFIVGTNFTFLQLEEGGLEEKYTFTDLLDNIMIYWVSGCITTSFRLYAETFNKAHMGLGLLGMPVKVPSACARFKYDFYAPDGLLREIYHNLVHLADYDGGHFAAFQQPQILASDIYVAVDTFEKLNNV